MPARFLYQRDAAVPCDWHLCRPIQAGKPGGPGAMMMSGGGQFGTFRDDTFEPAAQMEWQPPASNPPEQSGRRATRDGF